MNRYFAAASPLWVLLQTGCSPALSDANAQPPPGETLITRYVATWEMDAFFAEPVIAAELDALLGARRDEVMRALDVTGGIEYYRGALSVSGNAPHAGGENEAIVCVQLGTNVQVHVGHFVGGAITVYTRQPRYDFLPTCIKDWIGLENAAHAHRLRQPENVRLRTP